MKKTFSNEQNQQYEQKIKKTYKWLNEIINKMKK